MNYGHTVLLKGLKQITLNHRTLENLVLQILVAFIQTSLNVNLSFSQTVLTFWLYVKQTWMAILILLISL